MTASPPLRRAALPLIAGLVLTGAVSTPARAATTDAAFDAAAGALSVDYAGYLSKHDIVYNRPNTNPVHGLTVGNGAYRCDGVEPERAHACRCPVWTCRSSRRSRPGIANLTTSPAMDTGYSTFQQRLSLYDGTLTTKYDANRTVTVHGRAELRGHGHPRRRQPHRRRAASPSISACGTRARSTNSADVPNLSTWRTVSTFADATGAGFSRGQADPNHFGYTFAATVEGASYTAQVVNGTRVRLSITPTSSYTIWFTAASRVNAPEPRLGRPGPQTQLAAVKTHRLRHHPDQLPELVARLLGRVVRAVLRTSAATPTTWRTSTTWPRT